MRCRLRLFIVSAFLMAFPILSAAQKTASSTLFNQYEKVQKTELRRPAQSEKATIIAVASQEEFAAAPEVVLQKIKTGAKAIEVRLSAGQYQYTDGLFSFIKQKAPDVTITLSGENATLVAAGEDYYLKRPLFSRKYRAAYNSDFPYDNVLLDGDLDELVFSSGIQQTDTLLQIVDEKEKICRIHSSNEKRDKDGKHIIVTTWYTSVHGPVLQVEDGWIYFKSSKLQYNQNNNYYNINFDYRYAKRMPRYVVFNDPSRAEAYLKKGKLYLLSSNPKVHECTASSFIQLEGSQFKGLTLKGLSFVGSANGNPLISLHASDLALVDISDCTFRCHKNKVIDIVATDNVMIENCKFTDCYTTCVYSENGSKNTQITGCCFEGIGRDFAQNHIVWCLGQDYYIANNVFKNFSYAAIRTGVQPWDKKPGLCSGIIEYNEIYYDKEFFDSYADLTLMDSGAIYVSTQNDNTIIRYNYIHDYIGLQDNRGIFCDTGTKNTRIYGNIILNTPNSYTIELYRVESSDKWVPDANDGNAIFWNIVDGKYRFDGKDSARSNVVGKNYIVYDGNKPKVMRRTLTATEEDEYIASSRLSGIEDALKIGAVKNSAVASKLRIFSSK